MEIRDYIRMLKRGWPVVLLFAALFMALAAAYLALTPKSYESTAVLFVSTNDPATVDELQVGAQFSANAMNTYAEIVDSSTVLSSVAAGLTPQPSVDALVQMIAAARRPETTLIDVTATGENPEQVAVVANAAAKSAMGVIPALTNTAGQPLVRLQLIRPAIEPIRAISPNVSRILTLGFIVGACLGLSVAIATQALDTRIRRIHDLRMLTDVPILGVLPRVKRRQHQDVVVREEPAGASGEAFRTLRTNVRFLDLNGRRSLVFAAVADICDEAHVPDNLAWMLATAGHRVLLMDLDLRQSTVGDAMGIQPGIGIADVLAGHRELTEVINHTEHPNLQVVLSGTAPPNPSELLSAPFMASLLRRTESIFDYVILHTPPLLSFTDAAVVSGAAGGTVVTVTVGHTRAQELTTSLTVLENVGIRPLGLVLTRAGRSVLEHKKSKGVSTRPRFRTGRPMLHRLDWDWRNSDPGRHSAN